MSSFAPILSISKAFQYTVDSNTYFLLLRLLGFPSTKFAELRGTFESFQGKPKQPISNWFFSTRSILLYERRKTRYATNVQRVPLIVYNIATTIMVHRTRARNRISDKNNVSTSQLTPLVSDAWECLNWFCLLFPFFYQEDYTYLLRPLSLAWLSLLFSCSRQKNGNYVIKIAAFELVTF